jgi:hypothetical protein
MMCFEKCSFYIESRFNCKLSNSYTEPNASPCPYALKLIMEGLAKIAESQEIDFSDFVKKY